MRSHTAGKCDMRGESDAPESGSAPRAGEAKAGLIPDSVSLLDSLFDYLAARFRLEGYRLEQRGRDLFVWALILLSAGAVSLLGVVFVSLGIADLISERLHSRAAGLVIVGAFYLLAGGTALAVAARRGRREG